MKEMRLLVTQDCNYSCQMCHGEGLQTDKESTLAPDDFAFIFRVGKEKFGMDTTTLTGGEPLFRKDIVEIAQKLKGEGAKITLTTNGRLLEHRLDIGRYIDKVNVSVHSMDRDRYEGLVRVRGSYEGAKRSLKAFRQQYPDLPIIINTTCIKGVNADPEDLSAMINFAKEIEASIKIIELFPGDLPNAVRLPELAEMLGDLGFSPTSTDLRKQRFSDGETNVALTRIFCSEAIEAGNPATFCNDNNDLFISPDGKAKPCREDMMEVDFNPAIAERDENLMAGLIGQAFAFVGTRCIYA